MVMVSDPPEDEYEEEAFVLPSRVVHKAAPKQQEEKEQQVEQQEEEEYIEEYEIDVKDEL